MNAVPFSVYAVLLIKQKQIVPQSLETKT